MWCEIILFSERGDLRKYTRDLKTVASAMSDQSKKCAKLTLLQVHYTLQYVSLQYLFIVHYYSTLVYMQYLFIVHYYSTLVYSTYL